MSGWIQAAMQRILLLENSEKLENTYQIRFQIDQRIPDDGGPME